MTNDTTALRADTETGAGPDDEARKEAAAKERAVKIARDAVTACQTLLGVTATGVDMPGGARDSVRVLFADRSVIVTRRKSAQRARLEVSALYALRARGVPVPEVIAFDGVWLIQEDLGRRRLSQALREAGPAEAETWLDAALASLAEAQMAGMDAGLDRIVVTIGGKDDWVRRLLDMPARLGRLLDLAPPPLDEDAYVDFLRVRRSGFVKWDARPGNAMALDDGTVAWFDWEHCGRRNRLDDFGWLMADEYAPDLGDGEDRLIERRLPAFIDDRDDLDEARTYLTVFATIHSCVRLALILTSKKDKPWRDAKLTLAGDKVGVTRQQCEKGLVRAARWAATTPLTENLAPWFEKLVGRLPD